VLDDPDNFLRKPIVVAHQPPPPPFPTPPVTDIITH
jgi:hypothetical protein